MGKMIVVALVGVILISLASAGLVDFLSNKVTGSVSVEGPVFWFDRTDIMGDDSFSLKLNDNDVDGTSFTLKKGNNLAEEFYSEDLGVDDFYSANFNIILDSEIYTNLGDTCDMLCRDDRIPETENMSDGECVALCETFDLEDLIEDFYLSGTIEANLYLVNGDGQSRGLICSTLMIGVNDQKDGGYIINCEDVNNKMSDINLGDRLKLLLSDGSTTGIGTKTYIGDYSYMQVVAK